MHPLASAPSYIGRRIAIRVPFRGPSQGGKTEPPDGILHAGLILELFTIW